MHYTETLGNACKEMRTCLQRKKYRTVAVIAGVCIAVDMHNEIKNVFSVVQALATDLDKSTPLVQSQFDMARMQIHHCLDHLEKMFADINLALRVCRNHYNDSNGARSEWLDK